LNLHGGATDCIEALSVTYHGVAATGMTGVVCASFQQKLASMLPHFHINRVQLPAWRTQGSHIPDAASVQLQGPKRVDRESSQRQLRCWNRGSSAERKFLPCFIPTPDLVGRGQAQEVYDRFLAGRYEGRPHHHILVAETTRTWQHSYHTVCCIPGPSGPRAWTNRPTSGVPVTNQAFCAELGKAESSARSALTG
jgi:hypothetical protein